LREWNEERSSDKLLLSVMAIAFLIAIAICPYVARAPAQAQSGAAYPVFIEPDVQMLKSADGNKQLYGRVVVDLRTGRYGASRQSRPIRIHSMH
jgi:hypothetical protein